MCVWLAHRFINTSHQSIKKWKFWKQLTFLANQNSRLIRHSFLIVVDKFDVLCIFSNFDGYRNIQIKNLLMNRKRTRHRFKCPFKEMERRTDSPDVWEINQTPSSVFHAVCCLIIDHHMYTVWRWTGQSNWGGKMGVGELLLLLSTLSVK